MEPSIYFLHWLTLTALFSLATISPGPDFVLAVRNSIVYSRRTGLFTALGFGLGILVHVSYTVLGIAAIISRSILLFNAIKLAGAAYLIYIGVNALRSRGMGQAAVNQALKNTDHKEMSSFAALRSGFLTNVLNPKVTLFFLAIFSQIITPETPMVWSTIYGLTCAAIVSSWFGFVSLVLTHKKVRNLFLKAAKGIDRVCGALLIALGIKVALSSR